MHRLAVGEVINGRYEVTTLLRDGARIVELLSGGTPTKLISEDGVE